MKTIILTTVVSAFIAVSGAAQAAQVWTDPLLLDFSSTGQILNPHGIFGGEE